MASASAAASISTCAPVVLEVSRYTLLSISDTEQVRTVTAGRSCRRRFRAVSGMRNSVRTGR